MHSSSSIVQAEVESHGVSVEKAILNAMRRKADVIVVGETQDLQHVTELLHAAQTGSLVYASVLASGFTHTIQRMVRALPEAGRSSGVIDLISNLDSVLCRMMVPAVDGTMIALNEWVVWTPSIREHFLSEFLDKGRGLTFVCDFILESSGTSFSQDAQKKYEAGLISEATFKQLNRKLLQLIHEKKNKFFFFNKVA